MKDSRSVYIVLCETGSPDETCIVAVFADFLSANTYADVQTRQHRDVTFMIEKHAVEKLENMAIVR